jgi:glycerophosphoryl diester phosphodiesterase
MAMSNRKSAWRDVARAVVMACVVTMAASCSDDDSFKWPATLVDKYPVIIAHRGASGARPEHSIEAYRLAIEWGADYVEQDLVMSKDGVLMVLHDISLGLTTDVDVKYPDRYAKNSAGEPVNAAGTVVPFANRVWLPKDFTRAEIQTLLLKERYNTTTTPRTVSHSFDGKVGTVPTFEEAIQFIQSEEQRLRKVIGIYPETKSPQRHKDWGLPMEDELLRVLAKYGYVDRNSPVFIQSFEDTNLMDLKKKTGIRLIQLISGSSATVPFGNTYSYADMITSAGLARLATYAYGIGPSQTMVVSEATGVATDLAARARSAGLKVHSYTVRNDALPPYILALGYVNVGFPGEGTGGYRQMKDLLNAGVDGMFTDFDNTLYQLCRDNGWR